MIENTEVPMNRGPPEWKAVPVSYERPDMLHMMLCLCEYIHKLRCFQHMVWV